MTQQKKPLLLGAHISTAGGFDKAILRGESIGCTTIQLFTKSNRQWFAKEIDKEAIKAFRFAHQQSIIKDIVAHAAYLINLGSPNEEVAKKSISALENELTRCMQLGIPYLVLHPGAKGVSEEKKALGQIAAGINEALSQTEESTILLETMAGQGSNLCYSFEQIVAILEQIKDPSRVGICFDTCHVFAAGYDLRTREAYERVWQQFDKIIGLEQLKVIHVNDSKKELGTRVDRHEHVGKGKLGLESFSLLFNDSRFFEIPKILETPKEGLLDDLKNMHQIVKLLSENTKAKLEVYVPEEIDEAKSK